MGLKGYSLATLLVFSAFWSTKMWTSSRRMPPASIELCTMQDCIHSKSRPGNKRKPLLPRAASCHVFDQSNEKVANAYVLGRCLLKFWGHLICFLHGERMLSPRLPWMNLLSISVDDCLCCWTPYMFSQVMGGCVSHCQKTFIQNQISPI